ncbi:MAG: SUMF1/EgtB/PvdO family nonheme iron enzyme [Planctomycetaceae bacterium]|nr:SUMF1/EgtB/PvdO family nonheme iron enzyme [Planctomycetaceae bacterium]
MSSFDSHDFTEVERLWEAVVDFEGNPAPEVTIKGPGIHALCDVSTWVDEDFDASLDEVGDTRRHLGEFLLHLRASRVAMAGGPDPRNDDTDGFDFVLGEELGRGGMGVIYAARQGSLDRVVAVKMIAPEIAGMTGARQKIISEALITGELDHPNIIPIYDLSRTERDEIFYAMKVVNGTHWADRLATSTLRENLGILQRVADAVAFSHDKGIIHRDLKPGNVMLGDYGEVMLLDWGLAVSLDPSSKAERLNHLTALAGTPAYMAPEMALGETAKIGKATDIYLLGGILFEIVTGRRPHYGKDARSCLKKAARNAITPTPHMDDLLEVAYRAMATEPEDRYASVKEFQTAIEEVEIHRESRALAARAGEYLAAAQRDDRYTDYSRAIISFEEAVNLWPENEYAKMGVVEAKKKSAASAFLKTDYDLALESLDGLDGDDVASFTATITAAREEQKARVRRVRRLSIVALCLLVAVVAILGTATLVVVNQMRRERVARDDAREAVQARLQALQATQDERRRHEATVQARAQLADELSRKGILEDASWWAFSPAEARARQRAAAAELGLPVFPSVDLNGVTMDLVVVPAGEFVMGSNPRWLWHKTDQFLHRVVLTRPFILSRTEVTRGQWRMVVGLESEEDLMPHYDPAVRGECETVFRQNQLVTWGWRTRPLEPGEADMPATGVSAREVDELFLPALARFVSPGYQVTLPSEAQWEYAARSGTPGPYFGYVDGDDLHPPGWTRENSNLFIKPVGLKEPNAWGLQDMHGNAGEIVLDGYSHNYYLTSPNVDPVNLDAATFRVYRGGNIIHPADESLSSSRHFVHIDNRYPQIGFRVAILKDPPKISTPGLD